MKNLFKKIIILVAVFAVLLPPKEVVTPAFAQNKGAPTSTVTDVNKAYCGVNSDVFFSCGVATISAWILTQAANLLYMAGKAFDFAIDYSLDMSNRLNDFKFVSNGWAVLRDVTNLGYIFILLYIAINIILGNSGYGDKSMIAKVIITAIFVNFSLFGAKVIVDATNIGALQFYNLITPAKDGQSNAKSLTGQFMNLFNLQSIYGPGDSKATSQSVLASVNQAANGSTNGGKYYFGDADTWWRIAVLSCFGTIFVLAVTVVFFAGAFLFISRTVVIFFLMLFASMAVASRALPATKGQFDTWLKKLINNAIFAPIFLGLIYIFVSATNMVDNTQGATKIDIASLLLNGRAISGLVIFLMYLAFLVGLLLIAKQLGIKGGDAAHGIADKWLSPKSIGDRALSGAKMIGNKSLDLTKGAAKGLLRETVGRGLTSTAESGWMKNLSSKIPRVLGGGYVRRGLASVGKATGYEQSSKENAAALKKEHEYLSKSASKDPERQKWARERANSMLGMDENGVVKGWWSKTKRFIGGKGTRDAQDAIKKKAKSEARSAERKRISTVNAIEGVAKITGIADLIKKDKADPNDRSKFEINDKMESDIQNLYSALEGEADLEFPGGGVIKLGGVEIDPHSPLGVAASAYHTNGSSADKNDLEQLRKLLKSKLKTWKDTLDKEADKNERDEKAKKDDSKPKP